MVRGEIVPHQAIEISDGIISRLSSIEDANPSGARQTVDGNGVYALPGLWDMHVHTGDADLFFPLYVATGITGVRDMGGGLERYTGNLSLKIELLSAWREEVRNGFRIGPELLLAGPFVDGSPAFWPGSIEVTDRASARKAIEDVARRGADFIKVYHNLSSHQLSFVAEEAERAGIAFAGHIPLAEPAEDMLRLASDLGQASIEHVMQIPAAVAREANVISSYKDVVWAYRNALQDLDPERERRLYEHFRKNGTWFTTTASAWWGSGQLDQTPDSAYANELEYVPRSVRNKDPHDDPQLADFTARDYEALRGAALGAAGLAKRMDDAGVGILAGSDSANPGVVPGFGLHRELELLVDAGFTPAEALASATVKPAEFLDRTDIGHIAPGIRADIVLLHRNPLADIRNTRTIEYVILRGELLDRARLDALLQAAKDRAARL